MLPYLEVSSTHNTVKLGWYNKNQQPKCCQEGARPRQKVKIPKIQRKIPVFPFEICCKTNKKHHQNQHKHSFCYGAFYSPLSRYLDFTEHQFLSSLVFYLRFLLFSTAMYNNRIQYIVHIQYRHIAGFYPSTFVYSHFFSKIEFLYCLLSQYLLRYSHDGQ